MDSMNTTTENNSGRGAASTLPQELQGWNWGAFLLNWIWGIGNNTWLALLCFVPFLGMVMAIVLGIKGNEWAWQNKFWPSIAEFKRVQRIWTIAGLIVVAVSIVLTIAMFATTFAFVRSNMDSIQQEMQQQMQNQQQQQDTETAPPSND